MHAGEEIDSSTFHTEEIEIREYLIFISSVFYTHAYHKLTCDTVYHTNVNKFQALFL